MNTEHMPRAAAGVFATVLLCVLSACGTVQYMPNSSLREMGILPSEASGVQTGFQSGGRSIKNNLSYVRRGARHFGAIVIRGAEPAAEETEGIQAGMLEKPGAKDDARNRDIVFLIKREDGRLAAETELYRSTNPDKSWFDRSYFSIGTDRRNRTFGIALRFVY